MRVADSGSRRMTAGRTAAPGSGWQMTDALGEKVAALAREDAARGVYMGDSFLQLRRQEAAKAAPDRAALQRRFAPAAAAADRALMRQIEEGDRRMLCILFGVPYRGELRGEGAETTLHICDSSGSEVLTYTAGSGWQQKPTPAEQAAHGAMKAAYYEAWHAARQTAPAEAEHRGGFDGKA